VKFKNKQMSLIKNIWENKASIIKGAKNNIIRTKAIEELANDRLNICSTCPDQTKDCAPMISTCCALCGCSLAWKTRVPEQGCPAGKWPSLNIEK
jgi:hypothetical protein